MEKNARNGIFRVIVGFSVLVFVFLTIVFYSLSSTNGDSKKNIPKAKEDGNEEGMHPIDSVKMEWLESGKDQLNEDDATETIHLRNDTVLVDACTALLQSIGMGKTTEGFCEFAYVLTVKVDSSTLYTKTFCVAEPDDVLFVEKGPLTALEYYSSSVGWSQFYIIDFRKMRVVITKRLQESPHLDWQQFVSISAEVDERYVQEIIDL